MEDPFFFLVHYGGFCFGHGVFIFFVFFDDKWAMTEFPESPVVQIATLLLCIFAIVVEHTWLLFRFMAAPDPGLGYAANLLQKETC